MALMKRGANAALTREIPNLAGLLVGVRWDAGAETALADNLVLAAVVCDRPGHAVADDGFVFFNQLASPDGSVRALAEATDGDNDQLEIDLAAAPADVDRLVVVLYVNDGPAPRRTLGQLRSCAVRVLDRDGNAELVRSEDLAGGLRDATAATLAEVYRHDGWKFRVLGEGYPTGIAGLAADYHVGL